MTSRKLAIGLLVGASASSLFAQTPQLTALLAQLDAASAKFKTVQADVKYDEYTKIVKDHDLSSGTMYIERAGKDENFGAAISPAGSSTPSKIVNYTGGTLQVYSPGTGQDDVFKAGQNQAKYDSFLTLGFGGSGRDLAGSWNIQDLGPETIDGVKTEKLDLTGKDPSISNTFKHVTIWVDPARGVSLRQAFFQPNGDSRTATYSNIRVNGGKIDKKPYEIGKSAKKVVH
jgi:outer membrane lipoprotein-sorting protein